MKKIILSVVLLIVLAMVSAGIWGYFAFLYTKPLNKAELAELTPDWSVVTHNNWSPWFDPGDATKEWNPAASFNAWLATVPEEDKAWAVLVDVYYKNDELLSNAYELGSLQGGIEDWDTLKTKLADLEVEADVERVVSAFRLPVLGAMIYANPGFGSEPAYPNASYDPIVVDAMKKWGIENPRLLPDAAENPALLAADYPGLAEHRALVRLVESMALMKLESGDTGYWISAMDAVSQSAKFRYEFPTLINQLVAIAIEGSVNRHIAVAIRNDPSRFTDQDLVALDAILRRQRQHPFIWEGEALSQHDTARRMTDANGDYITSNLSGVGNFNTDTMEPCSLPDAKLGKTAQRVLYTINMSGMAIDTTLPWDTSRNQVYLNKLKHTKLPYFVNILMDMVLMSPPQVGAGFRIRQQETIAVRLAIALERHRLRHGDYPKSVKDIDPDLINFKPVDAFGGVLRVKLTDQGPTVYSLSDDRDDDGGAPMYKYDLEALLETSPKPSKPMMSRYRKSKKDSTGTRYTPLWITPERVKVIEAAEPNAVDGDWVLYPIEVIAPESSDPEEDIQDD